MELRRTEGRAHMDDACVVIVDERTHPARLVDLSPRGARVRTELSVGDVGEWIELGYKEQRIRAQIRFTGNGETGLRLHPEGKVQRATLRRVLRDRLMQDADGLRKHVRLSTRWKVAITSHDFAPAWVTDLAIGGLGLHTEMPLRVGDVVSVAFPPIGDDAPFIVSGTVQHVESRDGRALQVGIALDPRHDHERFYDQMQACWELGDGV